MGDGNDDDAGAKRATRAALGAGFFSNGVWDMLTVVVPLHALAVGLNAAEIGLVVYIVGGVLVLVSAAIALAVRGALPDSVVPR